MSIAESNKRIAKPVYLGSLGLMEQFRLPGSPVRYRTITYPPSNTCPYSGVRDALNMADLKAYPMLCRVKVFHVK